MGISIKLNYLDKLKYSGNFSFLLGILFLPSALPIGAFFILLSIIYSFTQFSNNFLKNRWNYPVLISIGIIILSCIKNSLDFPLNENIDRDIKLIWLDLFNWIPLFLLFWSSQNYLIENKDRKRFAKILLISNLPVLVSCIGQYWFYIEGPFYALKGLVVWFMKPLNDSRSMTGLFSNSNYLACWLSIVLPFSLVSFSYIKKKYYYFINILINFLIIYCLISTNSRNAFAGIVIVLSFLKLKSILLALIALLLLPYLFNIFIPVGILNFDHPFLPKHLIKRLIGNFSLKILDTIRIDIWLKAINLIAEKPFWGWGAASFPFLYISLGGIYKARHIHNMPLHLAHNYGIPFSIVMVGMITVLLIKSFNVIFKNEFEADNLINKAWFLSTFILVIFHIGDITYFDGKISIVSWILLGGLCSIVKEDELKIK